MGAVLDHLAALHDHDPVGARGRGQPVRHHKGGALAREPVGGLVDLCLGGQVERGGGLVEQQHVRVDEFGAGQRDQLALAGREVAAALGDGVQVAAVQRGDHVVGADRAGGRLDLGIARLGPPVRDGVADRPGEEVRLLRDDPEPLAVRGEVELPQVGAVGGDPARGRVVEPGHQLDQRGLAGAGLADEGDGLPGGYPQADSGQRVALLPALLGGAVGEAHVLEGDLPAQLPHLARVGRPRGAGGLAQQVLDPAERDGGLLVAVEDLGELLDGGEEQVDVEQVRHQCAGGEGGGLDPSRADDQHGGRGARGQQLDEGEVDGYQPLAVHPGLAVGVAAPGEPGGAGALAAEGLDDPQAGDGLLEVGVDQADPVAGELVRGDRLAAEHDRADDQQRERGEDDQGELDVEDEERDQDPEEGEDGDDGGDQACLQERGQRVHVGGHPSHDLAGQLALVVVEAEALELGEDLHAERVEHALAGTAGHPGLGELGGPLREHHRQGQERRRPDGAERGPLHALVDAVPDQDGQQQTGDRVDGDEAEADGERRPEAAQQAAQVVAVLGGRGAGLVDAGLVLGGRQCGHLGQQLGRGRHAGDGAGHGVPGSGRARRGGGGDGGVPGLPGLPGLPGFLLAAPELGGHPVDDAPLGVDRLGIDLGLHLDVLLEVPLELGHGRGVRGARRRGAERVRVGEQPPVQRGAALQLLVRADVGELPAVEYGDPVGERERGAAVGDEERGAAGHDGAQRLVDLVLDAGVHGGGGVVEEEQAGVGEEGAGEGDALALAAGEGEPLLADLGVVPGGQGVDESFRLGGAGGGADLLLAGLGVPVGDVGADGVGEEERILGHQSDGGAQRVVGQLAHVVAADADGAAVGVVEAGQEERDGGLAGAGGADDGDGLALGDGQGEPVEDGPLGVVAEDDAVELDGGGGVGGQLLRALPDHGLGVDELEHPLHAGAGLLADGEDHGEHADGADELGEVGGEGDEGAEGDLAAGGHPAAEGQHGDLAEGRDGLEGGGVSGVEADGPHPPGEEAASGGAQLAGLLVLLPEALDDADAGHGPVDDRGDGGGLALGPPGGGEELLAAALGYEPQGGGHEQRDEGQQRREPEHDPEGYPEEEEVADRHRQHEEQALDQLEVAGGPPDDLPGGQLVLAPPVEAGDGVVHVGAQVVLHVEGEAAAVVAAYVRQCVDEDGRDDEQCGPGPHRLRLVPDDVVDG